MATAVTGAVRAGWHLPLVLSGALLWVELAFIVALQVVLSWMFLGSTSLLPVMLAHLVSNSAGGAFVETWFGDGDRVVNAVARAVLWSLFALVLVVGTRARLGHDGPPGTSGAWGTSRGGGVPG